MKKTLLFLFALCSLTSSAQLKVYTNGNVGVGYLQNNGSIGWLSRYN